MSRALDYDAILARDGASRLRRDAVLAVIVAGVLASM